LGFDEPVDHALADDGVATGTEARTKEDIVNVAAPDLLPVDVVAAGSVARQNPAYRDLGIDAPLAGHPSFAVVEDQFDRRAPCRLAVDRAIEDDVLHGLTPQLRGLALAQHPSNGVDDVRLAAT